MTTTPAPTLLGTADLPGSSQHLVLDGDLAYVAAIGAVGDEFFVDGCLVSENRDVTMEAVRQGNYREALDLTLADNPVASMLGRVCDHLCETTCIRTHMDEPLAIREMKRFIMEHEAETGVTRSTGTAGKVAIIGASGTYGTGILARAEAIGVEAVVVTRSPYKFQDVKPTTTVVETQLHEEEKLKEAFAGCDGIISALGDDRKKRPKTQPDRGEPDVTLFPPQKILPFHSRRCHRD